MNKGRLIFSMFFLVITLTSSLKIAGTLGYYALFTEDFIERYCENKARPELHCDGKCYLAKMLLQESKDDTPPINIDLLKNETVLFLEENLTYDFVGDRESEMANYGYTNHYHFSFLKEEIQPPRS
ncbi:MAG: hypothetical protein WBM98_12065 [Maribacter sp.]|uniref:hypothetical protein n=1 Tax=Maribacter sp. TaxID=1897614 RepID=UPI003C712EF0